jgi:hypothetical protein
MWFFTCIMAYAGACWAKQQDLCAGARPADYGALPTKGFQIRISLIRPSRIFQFMCWLNDIELPLNCHCCSFLPGMSASKSLEMFVRISASQHAGADNTDSLQVAIKKPCTPCRKTSPVIVLQQYVVLGSRIVCAKIHWPIEKSGPFDGCQCTAPVLIHL